MTLPLYRRLLGARFDELPPRVRELHDVTGTSVWAGRADVERGALAGGPHGGDAVRAAARGTRPGVARDVHAGRRPELWTRRFGNAVFRSLQYERGGLLNERVGPSTFVFALATSPDGMALKLRGVRFLGVPLPSFLAPTVATFESEREGRYHFEVEASLPLLGRIVRYQGWLEREV